MKIVSHLAFDGVIGFDIRESPSGFFFLECNPRFWYNMDIAMVAGLNLVSIGLEPAASGRPVAEIAACSIAAPARLPAELLRFKLTSAPDRALVRYLAADIGMAACTAASFISRIMDNTGSI